MTIDPLREVPLLSNRTLRNITVATLALAILTIAFNMTGRWFGDRIALAGHTSSTETFEIAIGQDRLSVPANTIRFAQARLSGETDRLDLYLSWPEMTGYSAATAHRFNDLGQPGQLIFIQLSQSTMSRDMSGRIEPIYTGLFEGDGQPFDGGLSLHRLRADSGYDGEVMLTGKRAGQPDYAVRCILSGGNRAPSNADCQRDIFIGRDLSILYRFSSTLLPHWEKLDQSVRAYVEGRLGREDLLPRNQ